jgi:hypothetical protein
LFDLKRYWLRDYEELKKEYGPSGYKTVLLEEEVAFDAADMMKCGKDIYYFNLLLFLFFGVLFDN